MNTRYRTMWIAAVHAVVMVQLLVMSGCSAPSLGSSYPSELTPIVVTYANAQKAPQPDNVPGALFTSWDEVWCVKMTQPAIADFGQEKTHFMSAKTGKLYEVVWTPDSPNMFLRAGCDNF